MTDLVQNLKIGNSTYAIQDGNTLPALTAAQRTTLLSNGTYLGNPVETGKIFETSSGKFESYTDTVTGVTLQCHTATGRNVASCAAYGNGVFAAVASRSSYQAQYSTNKGHTWTQGTGSPVGKDIVYGNGMFVASGDSGCYYSTNGTSWTRSNNTSTSGAIAFGDGRFVCLGSSGYNNTTISYSTDGVNWTGGSLSRSTQWYSIRYGDGHWVAVPASSGKASLSTDGIHWSDSSGNVSCEGATALTYGNGVFVAVKSHTSTAYYSTDFGNTWQTTTLPTVTSNYWQSVTYGNGVFVAIAVNGGGLAYSLDGINWTGMDRAVSVTQGRLAYGDNTFVMVSDSNTSFAYADLVASHNYSLTPLSYTKSEVDTALDEKIGEDSIGNGLSFEEGSLSIVQASNPVWEQPQVTEPGTMGVSDMAVTESGYYAYSDYDVRAYQCFNDGSVVGKDHWQKNEVSTSTYEWISWYTKTPVNIKSILVRNDAGAYSPSNYVLEGSNDNSSWTTLTSGTNTNIEDFGEWTISAQNNSVYYNYYRLRVLPRTSVAIMIGKIFITGYEYTGTGTVAKATNSLYGLVKPDGSSITVEDGVISLSVPYETVETLPVSPTAGKIYFVTGSTT